MAEREALFAKEKAFRAGSGERIEIMKVLGAEVKAENEGKNAFYTLGAPGLVAIGKKVYYEVTLGGMGAPQFGFATPRFSPSDSSGVGDDEHSWACDGQRSRLWHAGKREWPVTWELNDVIGCAADMTAGRLSFSRNGAWEAVGFEGVDCSQGLFPALSNLYACAPQNTRHTRETRLHAVSFHAAHTHTPAHTGSPD